MHLYFALLLNVVGALSILADMIVESGFNGRNYNMNTVDNLGHAVLLYRIGEFDVVGTRVTLYAYWTSAKDPRPSVFGYGWHIPWFESCLLPRDAHTYVLLGVCGERTLFFKDKKTKDVFRSRHMRCAVLRKDEIKVYNSGNIGAPPDMLFRAGRLIQFRYRSKNVKLEYDNGLFSKMSVDGRRIISIEKHGDLSGTYRLVFGSGMASVDFARFPCGVCTGSSVGKPLVSRRETLVSLKTSFGERYVFSYGLDKTGAARMADGRQMVTWNPVTRLIHTLDDWTYNITEVDVAQDKAHYYRKRLNGEVEEYYTNRMTGMRTCERHGCRETARIFTSGKLKGLFRWRERRIPGGGGERTEFSYNENGILVYSKTINLKENKYYEIWNDEKGRIVKSRSNGDEKTSCEYNFASDGTRVVIRSDGKIVHRGGFNADCDVKWRKDAKRGLHVQPTKVSKPQPLPLVDVLKGELGK